MKKPVGNIGPGCVFQHCAIRFFAAIVVFVACPGEGLFKLGMKKWGGRYRLDGVERVGD